MNRATYTVIGRKGLRVLTIAMTVAVTLAASQANAAVSGALVFVVEDEAGVLLSDRDGMPDARVIVTTEPARSAPRLPAMQRFEAVVARAAHLHRLSPALLHAVIAVESGYAAAAVSPKGALGLMQLMPATAREYGVTHPFDPVQNVNAGARHLRYLLDTFGHDIALALAAYNAGAGAVRRHGGVIPPYAETRAYVPRVLRLIAQYDHTAALSQ